jgi:hypothetical protein
MEAAPTEAKAPKPKRQPKPKKPAFAQGEAQPGAAPTNADAGSEKVAAEGAAPAAPAPAAEAPKKAKPRKKAGHSKEMEIPADTPRILLQLSKPRKRKPKRAKKGEEGIAARAAAPAEKPNGKSASRAKTVRAPEPTEQAADVPAAAAERG